VTASFEHTGRVLVPPGKGILAADESYAIIGRRFEAVGPTPRRPAARYRQMLLPTTGRRGWRGVARQGILAGIKVDRRADHRGLGGLRERLAEYAGLGPCIAKNAYVRAELARRRMYAPRRR
jgi:fructose-bisphosphate aldolase class I